MLLPLAVTAQTYSLVVGVDGLGPYGIDAAATPYIDSLADGSWGGPGYRGAITLQAYAGVVETTRREVAELAEQFPVPAARLQANAEAVA